MPNEKDNLDEILAVNCKLRQVSEELEDNLRYSRELEEAEYGFCEINGKQTAVLEELSYGWKGDMANRSLHEAYEDKERELRNTLLQLDEKNSELNNIKRSLITKEEMLLEELTTLKHDNS